VTEPLYELEIEQRSGSFLARLSGEIDQSNASAIGDVLGEGTPGRILVVDLSDVRYLDSAGISMLESVRHGANLQLVVAPGSIIARVVTVTGLDQLVPTFESLAAVGGLDD